MVDEYTQTMNVYSQNFRFPKFKFCKTFEGIIQTRARVRVYIYIYFVFRVSLFTLSNFAQCINCSTVPSGIFNCFRIYERRCWGDVR